MALFLATYLTDKIDQSTTDVEHAQFALSTSTLSQRYACPAALDPTRVHVQLGVTRRLPRSSCVHSKPSFSLSDINNLHVHSCLHEIL